MNWAQTFLDEAGNYGDSRIAIAKATKPRRILFVEGYLDQWVIQEALRITEDVWEPSVLVTVACGKDAVLAHTPITPGARGIVDSDMDGFAGSPNRIDPHIWEIEAGQRTDLNTVLLLDIIDVERRGLVSPTTLENLRRTLTDIGALRRQIGNHRDRHGSSPFRGLSSPPFSYWTDYVNGSLEFDRVGFRDRCRRAFATMPDKRRAMDEIFDRAENLVKSVSDGAWTLVRGHDLGWLLYRLEQKPKSCACDADLWKLTRLHVADSFLRSEKGKAFVRRLSGLLSDDGCGALSETAPCAGLVNVS